MVDFELYRIFVTVADEKNLTKASKVLNISQPAVTKRIKNLEEVLNVKLFERSKSGMTLTSDGNKLYSKIKESVTILENAEKILNDTRKIVLGTRVTIFSRIFSEAIAKYYEKFPQMELVIEYIHLDELKKDLLNQKFDIGIYRKHAEMEDPNIGFIKLGETSDIFFVNSNYYKKMNKTFSKEDIKNEIIYLSDPTSLRARTIIKYLNYSEDEKKNIKYTRNTAMIEILKIENQIGAITKEYIKKELDDGTFKELKTSFSLPKVEYGIYYNKNNRFKELNTFIKFLENEFNN